MNRKLAMVLAMVFLPCGVQAQTVPAIDKTAAVEAYQMLEPPVQLDAKERSALQLANEWKNSPDKPIRGEDGGVNYVYGATMPVLICAVFRVCMVRLQEGERLIEDIQIGDEVRWKPFPLMVGPEGRQTLMIAVKPLGANLTTNMVVNTNRRSYTIILKSTKDKWIPVMGFVYPDDAKKAMEEYRKKQGRAAYASTLPNGQSIARNDFNYRMTGEGPWKPVRVYNNGRVTTIQFASAEFNHGAPALMELGNDGGLFEEESREVVNYTPIEDTYVVDGLPKRMILLSGVDKGEKKILIEYVGKNQ